MYVQALFLSSLEESTEGKKKMRKDKQVIVFGKKKYKYKYVYIIFTYAG